MRPTLTISRRLGATVSVVLSGLLVVSGCSVATDPQQVTPEVFVEPVNVTSSARAKDAAAAQDAAEWAERFALAHSFDDRFIDPGRPLSEQELVSAVEGSLSASAMEYWRAQVSKAVQGDAEALADLHVLTYVAPRDATLRPVADTKPVRSQQITGVQVSVDQDTQLFKVSFDYDAQLTMQGGRRPVNMNATKSVELVLAPASSATASTPATSPTTASPSSSWWRPGDWVIERYSGRLKLETS